MNLNKKLLYLLITLSVLLIMPISFANEDINATDNLDLSISDDAEYLQSDAVYVDSSSDVGGSGTSENPVKTISEGLNLVSDGGTVYLKGNYVGEGNSNFTLKGTPNNISFVGVENCVIDGNLTTSFAVVESGDYSFTNISFINNYKIAENEASGGVFKNIGGKLTFTDCLFKNNLVFATNKTYGGAIDNSGEITIINCIFNNNSADISNSSGFRKNAADGGAISNLGKIYVYNSTFLKNRVLRNGGAIRSEDSPNTFIKNCTFEDNVAEYHLIGGSYGGAIYTWNCGLELYDSSFINNRVYDVSGYGAQGGAISCDRGTRSINIYNCEFVNNTADGVSSVCGQSIFLGSGNANINYCTLDTSIYSATQSIDLDCNWWIVDGKINNLIENLPKSVVIRKYAELTLSTNTTELVEGSTIPITIKLNWNGSEDQDNIDLIPIKTIHLNTACGALADETGELTNGLFKTTLNLNNTDDPSVNVLVDNIVFNLSLIKSNSSSGLSVSGDEIFKGDTAVISINLNKKENGICLIDIGNEKYYVQLAEGLANVSIPNLDVGIYDVFVRYIGGSKAENTTSIIIVKDKINPNMNVSISLANVNVELPDDAGGRIIIMLDGNEIGNIAAKSKTSIALNNLTAGMHIIEVTYSGDEKYSQVTKQDFAASKLSAKINVDSKATFIACDVSAGEKGGELTFRLTDENNNPLSNKTVHAALNGKIYSVETDNNGYGKLQISLESNNVYTCAFSFEGDEKYSASALTISKLTVNKKKTSISASGKTFKMKSSKKISVTLKTVKNQANGKTYLKKGKKLTLTVNGKKYSAKTNAKGIAKFTIKLTKKGKYTAKVKFAGDKTYKSSSKSVKIIIK
ncbi:hypothetical protein [Methanobrevibacter sp.]|uniref:hypothetical protein n=1 Tax=Methanobrevibacter sp. TaxID=66852 RepID=UPI00386DFD11